MRSKTSYFSGAVFRKNLSRFWPLWTAYIFIGILAMPVSAVGNCSYVTIEGWSKAAICAGVKYTVIRMASVIMIPTIAIFSILSAMAVFSYLYSPKSAGMFARLPIRRESMYTSAFLSGFVWMQGANIIIALAVLLAEIGNGCLDMGGVITAYGIMALGTMLFYGLACFCGVLTGNILVLPVIYAIGNFVSIGFYYLILVACTKLIYGFTSFDSAVFEALSPIVKMLNILPVLPDLNLENVQATFTGMGTYEIYGAVGLALSAAGLLIYRQRKMETASDVIAIRVIRPVFKYGMTAGCALAVGELMFTLIFDELYGNAVTAVFILCMLFGAFIGYFAAEMLLRKTFRVFDRWQGFAISALIIAALVLCAGTDIFGYEKYVPENGDIDEAHLSCCGNMDGVAGADDIENITMLHQAVISSKAKNSYASPNGYLYEIEPGEATEISDDCTVFSLDFIYTLKNGRSVNRSYNIVVSPGDENKEGTQEYYLEKLINSEKAIAERFNGGKALNESQINYCDVTWETENSEIVSMELTPEQAAELYNSCVMPDLKDSSIGHIQLGGEDNANAYACCITIVVYTDNANKNDEGCFLMDIRPTEDSLRTREFLENLDIAPVISSVINYN